MNTLPENLPQQAPKSGLALLYTLILGLFCLFLSRFWYLQIYKGERFAEMARDNQIREENIYAPRGLIRDRTGKILAVNEPAYALALVREDCKDVPEALAKVGRWTGASPERLKETFEKGRKRVKPFEPLILVPDLSFEQLALIEANYINTPGLKIVVRPRRRYLFADQLAHLLGYVAEASEEELEKDPDLDLGDSLGKQGVELVLEQTLRGQKGVRQIEVDATGRRLGEVVGENPKSGQDVDLSLDLDLQLLAARELEGKEGAVVVMDADTGQVLAFVSAPGYDPNAFSRGLTPDEWKALRDDERHPIQNRVIQSVYPPGSVFKVVMTGAGLRENMINPTEIVGCSGSIQMGSHEFRCWRRHGHGAVNLQRALVESCDVYFYRLGAKLGVDRVHSFATAAGFGKPTGIDLPHEKGGTIPSREWKLRRYGEKWTPGENLNLGIGQGYLQVSPIQVARFMCAVVNGGRILKPEFLAGVGPEVLGTLPLAEKQLGTIREAMIQTVDSDAGTAKRLRTKGAVVGGKTGTAQVVKQTEHLEGLSDEQIPYKYRDHAWMASFGEKDGRRYGVVAMVEHGQHGASGAGPVVKVVYDYLFGDKHAAPAAPPAPAAQ